MLLRALKITIVGCVSHSPHEYTKLDLPIRECQARSVKASHFLRCQRRGFVVSVLHRGMNLIIK